MAASNICTETCPEGYDANSTTRTCSISKSMMSCLEDCYNCPSCASCANHSYCNACQDSFFLENGICVDSCISHPVSLNGVCVDSCPTGYVAESQRGNTVCLPCDPSCKNCFNTSANACLTCNAGSYLSQGKCLECENPCADCFGSAKNCTSCLTGYYYMSSCVSSCPTTYYPDDINKICLPCERPMGLTPNGNCVFCGGNCQLCSENGICLQPDPGLQISDGYCTIPGIKSSVRMGSGVIKSIASLSVLQYSTSQVVLAEFGKDVNSSAIERYWLLFAKGIVPDYLFLSCDDIKSFFKGGSSDFPSSVVQIGVDGFQYLAYTQSHGFYSNFSGLRANTMYNFTICINRPDIELWESGSIEFETKDNGYQIQKVSITTDNHIPQDELGSFLCALSSSMNVSNSTILTTEGISCNNSDAVFDNRRNLDDQSVHEPSIPRAVSNLRSLIMTNNYQGTQLDLLIYGDAQSEQLDQTTRRVVSLLTSAAFTHSFTYTSHSSGSTVKIFRTSVNKQLFLVPPVSDTPNISYEIKGTTMLFPNLTASGTNGYFYIYLIPNTSSPHHGLKFPPSSSTIISSINTLATDEQAIMKRFKFFNGEAIAVEIDGVIANVTYNIIIFATNEDVSPFAFRTPRKLFQIVTGFALPPISREASTLIFIVLECFALIFLVFAWHYLVSPLRICLNFKCLRKRSNPHICKPQLVSNPKEKANGKEPDKSPNLSMEIKSGTKRIEIQSLSTPPRKITTRNKTSESPGTPSDRTIAAHFGNDSFLSLITGLKKKNTVSVCNISKLAGGERQFHDRPQIFNYRSSLRHI